MNDRHSLYETALREHFASHLSIPPGTDEDHLSVLCRTAAAHLITVLDQQPAAVLHRYIHGPAGCRQQISGTVCGLTRGSETHQWPFDEDPAPVPERMWHTLRWTIQNPAAPAHVFDTINPTTTRSWEREDWGSTGEGVVVLWNGRFRVFYGGWDAEQVAAAWRADRDRLAAAGGFAPLPFGPTGKPGDELAEPPHVCDTDYCCWD
ncbi:hypothetical protein [Streptosporangium sp. NPDC051022]|uniref:hypothetical protein n=1 Tax=Streptosporangium sp. NPDC051022 TaxID=3155752 RepID=UPI00343F5B49